MTIETKVDQIVFNPKSVDEFHGRPFRPVGDQLGLDTFVLAAFNPGMTRLPNDNILLMVRVAEALKDWNFSNHVRSIRWDPNEGYVVDDYSKKVVADMSDPRLFYINQANGSTAMRLTSLSYLLPVEMDSSGLKVVKVHYNKAISPENNCQVYGIEDARITKIDNTYYMTSVGVSPRGVCTCLYESKNGIEYTFKRMIFDNSNKDVVLFEKKNKGKYKALTRPDGAASFAYPPKSNRIAGMTINLADSPDLIHWGIAGNPLIHLERRGRKRPDKRLGPGTPPTLTKDGWLELFHDVWYQRGNPLGGEYMTFKAFFDGDDPSKVTQIDKNEPVLKHNPSLSKKLGGKPYVSSVVFTTGIVPGDDIYIIASGERDQACRITHLKKKHLQPK